jgi:hypothetical protein
VYVTTSLFPDTRSRLTCSATHHLTAVANTRCTPTPTLHLTPPPQQCLQAHPTLKRIMHAVMNTASCARPQTQVPCFSHQHIICMCRSASKAVRTSTLGLELSNCYHPGLCDHLSVSYTCRIPTCSATWVEPITSLLYTCGFTCCTPTPTLLFKLP